jgi:hypothetical protein
MESGDESRESEKQFFSWRITKGNSVMKRVDSIRESESYILVEGPRWGDAEFYGKWLLAAAKAEALWKQAMEDSIFAKQADRVMCAYIPDFGMAATWMISHLPKNLASFTLRLDGGEEVEHFTMMVEMGFFVLTGQRYQMAIPVQLDMERVKRAALKFAQTEDDDCYLHPEHLVATMPCEESKEWQKRLRDMGDSPRCADRLLLLESYPESIDIPN